MKKTFGILLAVLCLLMSLSVSSFAYYDGGAEQFVYDDAALLTDAQAEDLQNRCAAAAESYGCGIYVVTLPDCRDYGASPRDSAEAIYTGMEFGVGENKNGIMLMLSMAERDYWLCAYGDIANNVFTDYRQDRLCDRFLREFSGDDWYDGFDVYVEDCAEALADYEPGENGNAFGGYYKDGVYYEDESYYDYEMPLAERFYYLTGAHWLVIIGGPCIIALVICLVLKGKMKTARIATDASDYIPTGGSHITNWENRFLHSTVQVRHRMPDNDSGGGGGGFSGGTSVSSSGFSGRGGKF